MIKGIGGVFLYSAEPEALAAWYEDKLGVAYTHAPEYDVWYISFPFIDKESGRESYQVFSILRSEGEMSGKGQITVNLRVEGLEAYIATLRNKGVDIKGPETHPEGIFAWTDDPAGTRIEFWEDTNMK